MDERASDTETAEIDRFIARWAETGGAEMANAQSFINELCDLLGVPKPDGARPNEAFNDYVFEKRVDHRIRGLTTAHRIDCYRRDSFILEAKQSSTEARRAAADPGQAELLPAHAAPVRGGTARRGTAAWDKAMRAAYNQAVSYVGDLPAGHRPPPFVLLVDVGHVIELYANFAGQGRNYTQFPDRRSFQIPLAALHDPDIRDRLRAVWLDPHSLDPAKKSAEVTRDIAERLARIARGLETAHDPRDVAEFLMRCLFTMFAEDVGLLPKDSFVALLERMKETPQHFVPALESLWAVMDTGGYAPHLNATVKRFNGALFKRRAALPLDGEAIHEMWVAARRDWSEVEPAIFGTLLERALDKRERSKLGAHYTPRAYVERLVVPTIIEPLREEWRTVQAVAESDREAGRDERALRRVSDFHHRLCTTRILDPACGTGNFLYVSLELMKRLEGEVLDVMEALGRSEGLSIGSETVEPSQFYGLEINPRAAAIADLVLWIGYLKWQLRTVDPRYLQEPVLHAYGTIRHQDAILAHDGEELLRGDDGAPLSRWDGVTKKRHPITGEDVPDPDATVPLYTYRNPRAADWPAAEFIVGNPPFIGGKDMRAELGDGYAEACWKARPHLPGGADFVMHFWDQAASYLREGFKPPRGSKAPTTYPHRFGFITTNSITQTFSRRVIERHLSAKQPLSLVFAVADHPWMKAADKAAVRIAMTVAEKGEHEGVLAEVVREAGLNTDTPIVDLEKREGKIGANLTLGADLALAKPLNATALMGHKGVQLNGMGFVLEAGEAASLRRSSSFSERIRTFANGRDLVQKPRGVFVIDTDGLDMQTLQAQHPDLYQLLYSRVKPERDHNPRPTRRDRWWVYGENAPVMRTAVKNLDKYIATSRTASHRLFLFKNHDVLCESKVVVLAFSKPELLSILSSRAHVWYALKSGGFLEDRPTYQHSETFDPFPFPGCVAEVPPALRGPEEAGEAGRRAHLAELGERLDAFRKQRLAEHDFLTMTGLYNVLERVRALEWAGRAGQGAYSSPLGGEGGSRSEPGEGQGGGKAPHPAPAAPPSPRRGEEPGATGEPVAVPPLSEAERAIYDAGLIAVLKEIHDDIDRAVFAAYGWDDLGDRLVGRPGATMPSPFKSEDQEAAEEELLSRLVALNLERQAEEKRGYVRWLRPDYQIPKLGHKVAEPAGATQIEAEIAVVAAGAKPPALPADAFEQIRLVRDALARAPEPVLPNQLAAAFAGKATKKKLANVEEVLRNLAELGLARTGIGEDGATRYFAPRG